jgi:hypothetical protein
MGAASKGEVARLRDRARERRVSQEDLRQQIPATHRALMYSFNTSFARTVSTGWQVQLSLRRRRALRPQRDPIASLEEVAWNATMSSRNAPRARPSQTGVRLTRRPCGVPVRAPLRQPFEFAQAAEIIETWRREILAEVDVIEEPVRKQRFQTEIDRNRALPSDNPPAAWKTLSKTRKLFNVMSPIPGPHAGSALAGDEGAWKALASRVRCHPARPALGHRANRSSAIVRCLRGSPAAAARRTNRPIA